MFAFKLGTELTKSIYELTDFLQIIMSNSSNFFLAATICYAVLYLLKRDIIFIYISVFSLIGAFYHIQFLVIPMVITSPYISVVTCLTVLAIVISQLLIYIRSPRQHFKITKGGFYFQFLVLLILYNIIYLFIFT
jgi:hypothetical protein